MKLIVTDLDGTLLNKSHVVSTENERALKKALNKGVNVAIASGRNYGDIKSISNEMGIEPYIISSNGGSVYDKHGRKLKSTYIDKKVGKKIIEWLRKEDFFLEIATEDKVFMEKGWEDILHKEFTLLKNKIDLNEEEYKSYIEAIKSMNGLQEVNDIVETLDNIDISLISVCSIDLERLNKVKEEIEKDNSLSCPFSGKFNFEVINKKCTKGDALEFLSEYIGINMEEIITIGDNFNDETMLKMAGVGVAMGNADDKIKKISNFITKDNGEDGVAYAVNKFLDSEEEVASAMEA